MIENYDAVMKQWAGDRVGSCTNMVDIYPDENINRWSVRKTITILANADYYYTKTEVDKIIEGIVAGTVTPEQVQEMINRSVAPLQSDLESLSAQVAANTAQLLNTYTKEETNTLLEAYLSKLEAIKMRDNYSRVDGDTLILNNEYEITI